MSEWVIAGTRGTTTVTIIEGDERSWRVVASGLDPYDARQIVADHNAMANAVVPRLARTVTRCWDQLARCEDEFLPEDPGACGEPRDHLDTAILELMRVADPERWEQRQQMMRDAVRADVLALEELIEGGG